MTEGEAAALVLLTGDPADYHHTCHFAPLEPCRGCGNPQREETP